MGLIHHAPSGWCPAGGELGTVHGSTSAPKLGMVRAGALPTEPRTGRRRHRQVIVVKSVANPGVSGNRTRAAGFFYSPGVTEPATIGPHDASPHAGQVVRHVLLRRNIVIDTETARLVAAAVQAALQAGVPSGRRAGPGVFLRPIASHCSDNGSCPGPGETRHLVRCYILVIME